MAFEFEFEEGHCKLRVLLARASNLADADGMGLSDPFAVAEVGGARAQTKVLYDTLNPVWNEWVELDYTDGDSLTLEVWDKDQGGIFNPDDCLGKAVLECGKFYPYGFVGDVALEGGDVAPESGDSTLFVEITCCTADPIYRLHRGGWRLVRRVKQGTNFHPAKDHLRGTEAYGDFTIDTLADSTFSRVFEEDDFDEFLFATGDGSEWIIAAKDEVQGVYDNELRELIGYSGKCGAYRSAWKNRDDEESGPWIAPIHTFEAAATGAHLYGTGDGEDDGGGDEWTKFTVNVVKAQNLRDTDLIGESDPYCVVSYAGSEYTTRVIDNCLNPVWNRAFDMQYAAGESVSFKVFDKDMGGVFNPDDALGEVVVEHDQFHPDGFSGDLPLGDGDATITIMIRRHQIAATCCQERGGLNVFIRKTPVWAAKSHHAHDADTVVEGGDKIISAQVWLGVGEPGFVFPELRDDEDGVPALKAKPNFAVCISGGGMRATTNALGWIRILHAQKILAKARYLCSNSGGTWFNTCFSYQEIVPAEVFLGSYIPPGELTPDLEPQEGSYGKVVADGKMKLNIFKEILKGIFSGDCFREKDRVRLRAWSDAVGDAFLSGHGLNDADCGYAMPGLPAERAFKSGVRKVHKACRHPDMPYPIMVGTVMIPGDEALYESYEFTPQYSGVPARIEDAPISLGGVLVEPLAASSQPPVASLMRPPDQPYKKLAVDLDVEWVVPLIQVAGISSQFIAQNYADCDREWSWEVMGCPEMYYWNGQDFQGQETMYADGGGTDNMAVFPPLRRGVKKMLICAAIGSAPTEDFGKINYDLSGYFGAVPEDAEVGSMSGSIEVGVWNRHVQVFPSEKWDELQTKVLEQHAAGEPLRVRLKMEVLANTHQGVAGGYEVDTLWIFNGGFGKWSENLPGETKELISESMEGFPFISVMKLDYSPQEVSCLSQLSSWNMLEAMGDIKSLLLTA